MPERERVTIALACFVLVALASVLVPTLAHASVAAKMEVVFETCCYGYDSTKHDVLEITGGPGGDRVEVVSVPGGYEVRDPGGVTPAGSCAAVSAAVAHCTREADAGGAQILDPEVSVALADGDDELSLTAVAADTSARVLGGSGADRIYGGAGNDTFADDDSAPDHYDGGEGFDVVEHLAPSSFSASLALQRAGEDAVTAVEALRGNAKDDQLTGGSGKDVLEGAAGGDTLSGGDGDDTLFDHDTSPDVFEQSNGDDVLRGGPGDDTLYHSGGRDVADCGPGLDDTLVVSSATPSRARGCERSVVRAGQEDDKYQDMWDAGEVRLERIHRVGRAVHVPVRRRDARAVTGSRWSPGSRRRPIARRTARLRAARARTVRLRLDAPGLRLVRGRRPLVLAVTFQDPGANAGGRARYQLRVR
jgi:hypothetical protein